METPLTALECHLTVQALGLQGLGLGATDPCPNCNFPVMKHETEAVKAARVHLPPVPTARPADDSSPRSLPPVPSMDYVTFRVCEETVSFPRVVIPPDCALAPFLESMGQMAIDATCFDQKIPF